MRFMNKSLVLLLALGGSALASGCGDSLTTVAEPAETATPRLTAFFSQAPAPGMSVLRRTEPLENEHRVSSQFNYWDHGWLSLPHAGIHVFVPEGAVLSRERVQITLTALAGGDVAFEFAPHGITFAKPLTIRVDAEDTEAEYLTKMDLPNGRLHDFLGVYWEWTLDGQAFPVEKFPIYWNNMKRGGPGDEDGVLQFSTNHFSGYAIAM